MSQRDNQLHLPARRFLVWSFLAVVLSVSLAGAAPAAHRAAGQALPEACTTSCASPYGTVLGTAAGGVTAYSNCKPGCVVFVRNTVQHVYTGIQWQCVEFARRWLLVHRGAVYGDVDVAADIWNRIDHLERVDDRRVIPLTAHANGARQAPAVGDLLVYAREYLGTGHVAVITAVDLAARRIEVAEENYLNRPWPGDYARAIELIVRKGRYWVLDPYLLGWKHAAQ